MCNLLHLVLTGVCISNLLITRPRAAQISSRFGERKDGVDFLNPVGKHYFSDSLANGQQSNPVGDSPSYPSGETLGLFIISRNTFLHQKFFWITNRDIYSWYIHLGLVWNLHFDLDTHHMIYVLASLNGKRYDSDSSSKWQVSKRFKYRHSDFLGEWSGIDWLFLKILRRCKLMKWFIIKNSWVGSITFQIFQPERKHISD